MTSGRSTKVGLSPTRFAAIGSELVAFTLLGVIVDWLAGSLPWVTIVATLLGFVVVMFQLARAVAGGSMDRRAPKEPGS